MRKLDDEQAKRGRLRGGCKRASKALAKHLKRQVAASKDHLRGGLSAAGATLNGVAKNAALQARPQVGRAAEVFGKAKEKTSRSSQAAAGAIRSAAASARQRASSVSRKAALETTNLVNAALASDFAIGIERWLGETFNTGLPSVYDKAADAVYHATHIGGGRLHRLFDGSHTLWDIWDKVVEASPDDSFAQEVAGYFSALGKDLSSRVGLPVLNMDPESYHQTAEALSAGLGIPREWFADLLHVNAVELFGAVTGALALALGWTRAEIATFGRLAAGSGISALASASPALAVVALVALAKAFMDARAQGNYSTMIDGLAKGSTTTGVFLASASLIGGPAWVGVMAGVCASIAAQKAMRRVDFAQVSEFVAGSLQRALADCANLPRLRPESA